jgi:hypothetical protein
MSGQKSRAYHAPKMLAILLQRMQWVILKTARPWQVWYCPLAVELMLVKDLKE